jgi:hypothetical protein
MSNLEMHSTQKDADSRKSKHCAQPTARASFSFVFTDCLLLLHLSLLQATSSRGRLFGPFLVTLELRLPAPLLLQLNLTPHGVSFLKREGVLMEIQKPRAVKWGRFFRALSLGEVYDANDKLLYTVCAV